MNITSFELFICTYIKDRGMPEGAVLKILKVDQKKMRPFPSIKDK